MLLKRPRLALPFTVIPSADQVLLVAGEDHRYRLAAPGIERWLPALLDRLDGRTPTADALAGVPEPDRADAAKLIERLAGERVLIEGDAPGAHRSGVWRAAPEGDGPLVDRLRHSPGDDEAARGLPVLCQDRLDLARALAAGRAFRAAGVPWIWASPGPLSRAYVSPVFLPDAGPCLGCLLGAFALLSPEPEVQDALVRHGESGRAFAPVEFPGHALAAVEAVVRFKLAHFADAEPPAALWRLHVVEVATLETSTHPLRRDPACENHDDA